MNFRESSAGFLANHMARLFASALAEGLRPLGIAPAQFMVLLELWQEDGVTQRQLVDLLDVEQATMASTLNRMERDGLIERRAHAHDRRAQLIHLTERARGMEREAKDAARRVNERALSTLSAEEQAALARLMRDVIGALRHT